MSVTVSTKPLTALLLVLTLSSVIVPRSTLAEDGLIPYVAAIPRLEESNSTRFGVFQVERYDTNFFRLPNGVDPPDSSARGGTSSTTGFGLSFDKSYGLQRVVLSTSIARDHYPTRNELDAKSERLNGAYYWHLTPAITGTLVFDYLHAPTAREYVGFQSEPSLQTNRTTRLEIDARPGAALHPRISIYEQQNTSQDATFQLENSRSHGAEVSLIYDFRSGNLIQPYTRRALGEDTGQTQTAAQMFDPNFKESESGLKGRVTLPGVLQSDIRLGRVERSYQTIAARDFSGFVGSLDTRYTLTGKTTLVLSITRNFSSSQSDFSSYSRDTYGNLRVDWAVTGKIMLRPAVTLRRQSFSGAVVDNSLQLKETTRSFSLQGIWAVTRAVDLSAQVLKSSRSASDSTYQFEDSSASVLARLKF